MAIYFVSCTDLSPFCWSGTDELTCEHILIILGASSCESSVPITCYAKATLLDYPHSLSLRAMPCHAGPNISEKWYLMSTLPFLLLDMSSLRPTQTLAPSYLQNSSSQRHKCPFTKKTLLFPSLFLSPSHHPLNPCDSVSHQL